MPAGNRLEETVLNGVAPGSFHVVGQPNGSRLAEHTFDQLETLEAGRPQGGGVGIEEHLAYRLRRGRHFDRLFDGWHPSITSSEPPGGLEDNVTTRRPTADGLCQSDGSPALAGVGLRLLASPPSMPYSSTPMGVTAGNPGQSGVLVTREVRWFFEGDVPDHVSAWFESPTHPVEREHRVDTYDFGAARRRVGIKVRDIELFDSKLLLSVAPDVVLAPGLVGHVEDWMKITEPANAETRHLSGERVHVSKEIVARRYTLNRGAARDLVGCDVELARVVVGHMRAWTVCFETFGVPELRQEGLQAGVDGLLEQSPLPPGLEFAPARSFSYPEWISRIQSGVRAR